MFGVGYKLEACILTMHGYGEVAPRFALNVNVGAAVSLLIKTSSLIRLTTSDIVFPCEGWN